MKNSRSLLLIPALALLALGSCSKPEKNTLRLQVDNIDRSCPVDLGSTGVMESARYDEKANRVVLTYVVNEDEVEIAGLSKVTAEQKTFLSSFLRIDISQFAGRRRCIVSLHLPWRHITRQHCNLSRRL